MKILAIDTSTRMGSVALLNGERLGEPRLVAEIYLDCDLTYSERLLQTIQQTLALARISLDQVEGLAMAIGPGSFTALRVGLATMKGLALAKQLPLVGVSSLQALALHGRMSEKVVVPVLDARREEVYAAAFRFQTPIPEVLLPDCAIRPQELVEKLSAFGDCWVFGEGVKLLQDVIATSKKGAWCLAPFDTPRAYHVGLLGLERLQQGEGKDGAERLLPNYLRLSDAERSGVSSKTLSPCGRGEGEGK